MRGSTSPLRACADFAFEHPPPLVQTPLRVECDCFCACAVLDGAWHHTCIDLGAQARDTLFQEGINIGPAHRVLSVVFNSTDPVASPSIGSFFIDEFSVSSLVRCA